MKVAVDEDQCRGHGICCTLCPEAPRPEFAPHLESFLAAVAGFVGP